MTKKRPYSVPGFLAETRLRISGKTPKHDHRRAPWLVMRAIVWCSECGAWKFQVGGKSWHRPAKAKR